MKILLMGPVGSGKGTQGELLSEYLGLPLISVGQTLRDLPKDHRWYKEINDILLAGTLAPQDKVSSILRERTSLPDCKNGFIMDGWGRSAVDLDFFDPHYDKVILIDISKETTLFRLSTRRTCASCGAVFNIKTMPPKVEGVCDKCGGALIQRDDDKQEAIIKRMEIFKTETQENIKKFRERGILVEVSGENSPEQVFKEILNKLSIG